MEQSVTGRVKLFKILEFYLQDPKDVAKIEIVKDARGELWIEWAR